MNIGKKDKKLYILLIIVIALFFVFLLFPRAYYQRDGGSAIYDSFAGGIIYKIDYRHRLYEEGGNVYYQKGCIIYIFCHEVFNNVHVDYSQPAVETHSSEYYEIRESVMHFIPIININSSDSIICLLEKDEFGEVQVSPISDATGILFWEYLE